MGHVYITFKTDDKITDSGQRTESWLTRTVENSLAKILSAIIPKANPDFEGKITNVRQWMLEVDEEDGTPEREIGLDDKGKVMMIMPWKGNYGFWTDSPVQIDELAKTREMNFVDKEEFDRLWTEFDLNE
jgi:hypothetical protein